MTPIQRALVIGTVLMTLTSVGALGIKYLKSSKAPINVGDSLDTSIADFDSWTIVAVLSPSCRFCTASMPFYARVRSHFETTPFIVVGRETTSDLKAYAEAHGLKTDHFQQVTSGAFRRMPTPTLLLVDPSGIVRSVWRGQLKKDGELAVMRALTTVKTLTARGRNDS